MYILKAIAAHINNGELEKREIYITADTINDCFEELVKYKRSSDSYITVENVYLV